MYCQQREGESFLHRNVALTAASIKQLQQTYVLVAGNTDGFLGETLTAHCWAVLSWRVPFCYSHRLPQPIALLQAAVLKFILISTSGNHTAAHNTEFLLGIPLQSRKVRKQKSVPPWNTHLYARGLATL